MTTTTYDIHNPTPGIRVIYDGSSAQKQIVIQPGDTKKNVPLAAHIVERMRESDLKVTESKPVPFTSQTDDPQKMKPTLGLPGLKKTSA